MNVADCPSREQQRIPDRQILTTRVKMPDLSRSCGSDIRGGEV